MYIFVERLAFINIFKTPNSRALSLLNCMTYPQFQLASAIWAHDNINNLYWHSTNISADIKEQETNEHFKQEA